METEEPVNGSARSSGSPPDTHEMIVIHRAFRRETRLIGELIASIPNGDTTRAAVLAAHLDWYQAGLANHHQGEDELIWPLLRHRAIADSEIVSCMEHQHERVAQTLHQVDAALPVWRTSAGTTARDELVAALIAHRSVLIEHLDDEERHLLPLVTRYLTEHEWASLGEHFVATTPKTKLIIFLGAVLEEASTAERRALLDAMPLVARLIWGTVGQRTYVRRMRQVRRPLGGDEPRSETRVRIGR
jgi:hemerythrin-like domain-containing protein